MHCRAMATDNEALLRTLVSAGVEFIVIGGAAAVAHGAATPTQDLDIAAPMQRDDGGDQA